MQRLDASGIAAPTAVRAALAVESIGEPRQLALQRSLQALLGQSMQGAVLARLGDGSSLVNVAGGPVRMTLPPGFPVGAEVPLTLVALDPRPTFQIGRGRDASSNVTLTYADPGPEAAGADATLPHGQSGAAQQGAAAQTPQATTTAAQAQAAQQARPASLAAVLLSKAPLTPSNQLPGFDPSAPAPALSGAARAISSILQRAESRPGAPLGIVGGSPLMAAPDAPPAALAHSLRNALGSSGLFYESHVAEWAAGKRPLQDLLREPQMAQLSQAAQAQRAAGGTDLAAAQLINLQLHTHEQARVLWQGEAWPGQPMEWEVHKDAPDDGRGERDGDEAARTWRSGVRFRFPLLGDVNASVVLVGDQVHIQVSTGSAGSAAALRLHADALETSMAAAGSPLSSLTIGADDGAGHAQ
ncbi:flagellar hook-length control protein FliK [Janthinobacterium sp. CG_S6]|uniref:flagellar hook-length control protein FliK n=1 Tax=Janthinobacterium sp. CG_S6 TaxID=3071707 RepID=UPI002DF9946C|nr:hypothetical protein [Janthinobacterium sp. CG_S6]